MNTSTVFIHSYQAVHLDKVSASVYSGWQRQIVLQKEQGKCILK